MNIMIASDIHGSAYYCRKLMKAFSDERADTLLLLGDILDGSDYEDVADMLNTLNTEYRVMCVMGNCDCDVDQKILDFPMMAQYCMLFVKDRVIFASHGHNRSFRPKLATGDIWLQGHTHVPCCEYKDGHFRLNPGSVSLPRRGSVNSYMILNDEGFFWKDLDGKIYNELRLGNP